MKFLGILNRIRLLIYGLIVALLVFSILFIKSFRTSEFWLVCPYTIFITTFMLSRVVGSFFYKSPAKIMKNGEEPSVSIVIPCRNEEKAIYNTIKNYASLNYPKEKIEIIVINDASTDNTLSEMQRAKKVFSDVSIKIINWEKNRGKREGMNAGFRLGRGEIIVQVDSDSYPEKTPFKILSRLLSINLSQQPPLTLFLIMASARMKIKAL